MYTEGVNSTVTHNQQTLLVDDLLFICKSKPVSVLPINEVSWILEYTSVSAERVIKADTQYPLIVLNDNGTIILLDGAHRLTKLVNNGNSTVNAYIINLSDLAG